MSENVHKGHRERLKTEIVNNKRLSELQNDKLLEMLLFYGIPQKDTAWIARELLNHFGSLSGVIDADIEELCAVKGMTRNAASLIKLIRPVARNYILSKYKTDDLLKNLTDIGEYMMVQFSLVDTECCAMLCLNRLGKVLSFEIIGEGDVDSVGISPRTVLEKVLKTEATAVVLAHNHPGGIAIPSELDVIITTEIAKALRTVSVNLIDHVIIADDDYVSMAQSKRFVEIFE